MAETISRAEQNFDEALAATQDDRDGLHGRRIMAADRTGDERTREKYMRRLEGKIALITGGNDGEPSVLLGRRDRMVAAFVACKPIQDEEDR